MSWYVTTIWVSCSTYTRQNPGCSGVLFATPLDVWGKSEEMFNGCFTINVVKEIAPALNMAERRSKSKPIKMEKNGRELNQRVLTVHVSVHKVNHGKQVGNLIEDETMALRHELPSSKFSRVYVQANYKSDRTIQRVIKLVKDQNVAVISRLHPPWREKLKWFSVDAQGLLFID